MTPRRALLPHELRQVGGVQAAQPRTVGPVDATRLLLPHERRQAGDRGAAYQPMWASMPVGSSRPLLPHEARAVRPGAAAQAKPGPMDPSAVRTPLAHEQRAAGRPVAGLARTPHSARPAAGSAPVSPVIQRAASAESYARTKKAHYRRPNISDETLVAVLAGTQAEYEGVAITPEHVANAVKFVGAGDERFMRGELHLRHLVPASDLYMFGHMILSRPGMPDENRVVAKNNYQTMLRSIGQGGAADRFGEIFDGLYDVAGDGSGRITDWRRGRYKADFEADVFRPAFQAPQNYVLSDGLPNEVVGNYLDVSDQHVALLGPDKVREIHDAWRATADSMGLHPGKRDVPVYGRAGAGDPVETHSVAMIGHDSSGSFKSYVGSNPDFYDQSPMVHEL